MISRIKNELVVVLVSFFIVMCFFGKIVLNPNNYLLQWEHDGTSAYYGPLFYINNDSEDHFTGMNYPYGENFYLVSGHYNFTKIYKFFNVFTESTNDFVGFLNLFIFLLIPIGSLIIYKILLYYEVSAGASMVYSIIIGFLSPQIGVMAGYFQLGCIFIFPFFWYVFIKYFEINNFVFWGAVYVLFTTFWMSAYFCLFGSIFFLLFYIANLLLNKSEKHFFKSWKFNLYSLFCLLFPIIAFAGNLSLDVGNFNDRIKIPSGADYLGFPINLWPKYIFDFPLVRSFVNFGPLKWQGITYFGFLGTVFLIIYVVCTILKKYSKHNFFKEITILPSKFNISLFVALLVFLISTNILFHTKIFELIPILNPFQQLRGFPRLAYFVYFPVTIFSIIIMLNTIKYFTVNRRIAANFLFVGVTLFWGGEATFNLYAARSYIFSQNKTHNAKEFLDNDENYFQILEKNNYNPSDFSCVLSLPFSSQGSEKLSRVNEESFYQSFKASYNLKLPMIGGLMNRSSITQVANSFQLFSDPLIKKEILNDFTSQKPILIIKNKDYSISKNEERLVSKSSSFFKGETFDLFYLELDSIKALEKEFYNIAKNIDSLYLNQDKESLINVTNKTFDQYDNSNILIGNGSFYLEKGSVTLVDTTIYEDSNLNISFWMFLDDRKYGLPKISIVDSNGSYLIDPLETFCIYKNWIRVEHTLNTSMVKAFRLKIEGDFISIDNLVIKKDGTDFIQKIGNKYIYNNYVIED